MCKNISALFCIQDSLRMKSGSTYKIDSRMKTIILCRRSLLNWLIAKGKRFWSKSNLESQIWNLYNSTIYLISKREYAVIKKNHSKLRPTKHWIFLRRQNRTSVENKKLKLILQVRKKTKSNRINLKTRRIYTVKLEFQVKNKQISIYYKTSRNKTRKNISQSLHHKIKVNK